MYHLHGLSFREFLQIQQIVSWPAVSLPDLLKGHTELALDLTQGIKPLMHWNDYLQYGYYPYFLENKDVYVQKLTETIHLSLGLNLPAVYGISYASVDKLKQLLVVLAESVPMKPNISKLGETLNTSRAGRGVYALSGRAGNFDVVGLEVGYGDKIPLWMFGLLY
ncbi:MAG: hypothetical protein J7619_27860 [Dyadobacter sp.]|uniref:hypothetical protein n=1 Tax=Dyadobacter sp. TaxID=1914288 RepID=UPI001B0D6BC9|nr:hypothetical protein [Dyadobacter sp.]MBO9616536.1 hypothetical protein [Dyadobacter sp.]